MSILPKTGRTGGCLNFGGNTELIGLPIVACHMRTSSFAIVKRRADIVFKLALSFRLSTNGKEAEVGPIVYYYIIIILYSTSKV